MPTRPLNLTKHEETHTYRLNGKHIPGVTTMLKEMGELPNYPDHTDFYKLRGRAVAKMMELEAQGRFDPSNTHAEVLRFYPAFKAFRERYPIKIVASELELAHAGLWYAGTTDMVALIEYQQGIWSPCIIDGKCSDSAPEPAKATKLQTAAYMLAVQSMISNRNIDPYEMFGRKVEDKEWMRFGLMLYPSDKPSTELFRLVPYTDEYEILAWKGITYHFHWRSR
ncbi:MAG: hypothetical protein HC888_07200 [Candidatus Competibacteraceae bacterium]|nr:hypothetical protein [Candidatus Competibacteraceae bacterium]